MAVGNTVEWDRVGTGGSGKLSIRLGLIALLLTGKDRTTSLSSFIAVPVRPAEETDYVVLSSFRTTGGRKLYNRASSPVG